MGQLFLDAAAGGLGDFDLLEVEVLQDENQLQLLLLYLYLLHQPPPLLQIGLDLFVLLPGALLDGSHQHLYLIRLLFGLDQLSMEDDLSLLLALLLGLQFGQILAVEGQLLLGLRLALGQALDAVLEVAQHIAVMVDMLGQLEVGVNDSFELLHLLLPGQFGDCLDGEGVLVVDFFLQGLDLALDVVFEVDFDHPFPQLLLEFDLLVFDLAPEAVAVPFQPDDLLPLAEVVLLELQQVALLLLGLLQLDILLFQV